MTQFKTKDISIAKYIRVPQITNPKTYSGSQDRYTVTGLPSVYRDEGYVNSQ